MYGLLIALYSMDAQGTPFMTEFASCWGLLVGSLLIASPIIFFKIKEHSDVEEDLKFSDETRKDVGIPLEDSPMPSSPSQKEHGEEKTICHE
jgi:hypothetical protein